jgi:dipeptidyl aminopeptidase/acylaminoacyl peptidase
VYNLITEDGFGNMSMIQTPFQLPLLYPRTPVTSGTGVADNHPAWSPDGTKLAFTSNRSGLDNIWIVNVDGSGLMQLTTATGYLDAKYPSWSPNGAKIAYISHDADPQIGGFGAYYLYTMNPDGSGQMRHPLPPRTTQDSGDQFWEFEIKFTEWLDNDRIAFVSYGPDGGSYKLYSYRLSTGAVTQIIPSPEEVNPDGDIYRISWNAAKGRLAYDRWPIGIQTITDTGANYQILNIPRIGQMDTPAQAGWRPDGNQLAFVKNYYGASNIAIFDPASGTVLVEQTASDDEWPAWSPDGGRIAFVSDGLIKLMTLTSPTVSVTGKVNNWEGTAPLAGVTVDLLGSDSPQSTTTDGSGNFSFSNIPAGQSFYLRFRSTGLVDVYTGDLSFNGAMASVDLGTYSLPATTDLTRFNLGPGKGIIMGRIQDQQLADGARIGGVVVTATSQTHPAPGYTVTYQDPLGNLGGTATYGNGRYYVLNVDEDTVTVRATKGNRTPVQRLFHTFAGAVNQGSLRTAAPGYDLSIGGIVSDSSGTVQGGATVAINRYPAKSMTTGENGAYQLANLPRDANMSLKITKGGFLPAYTAGFNLGGSNLAGIPLTLFNQTDFNNMGIQTGRGLIAGRVVSDTLAPQAGARITAVSNKGQTYVVQYGQGGGTATLANGAFWIPNVVNGDVVTITVAHSGYIYSGVSYMEAVADAVVEKLFIGTLRKADINGDGRVDLADAILVMKVMAGIPPGTLGIRANYPTSGADVNGDNLVGAHELIYIIQYLGGLRP